MPVSNILNKMILGHLVQFSIYANCDLQVCGQTTEDVEILVIVSKSRTRKWSFLKVKHILTSNT